mmetsp:Transcript_24673/g.88173  ORF Transcript_24673/g.88173 Transcript_24673/m.88173 type:complete len:86 (+) Transcript_24673:973-1230(+)
MQSRIGAKLPSDDCSSGDVDENGVSGRRRRAPADAPADDASSRDAPTSGQPVDGRDAGDSGDGGADRDAGAVRGPVEARLPRGKP